LTAPPINQLLATGGVLFILQSFATVAFGIDFRNLGIRLPVLAFGEMHFSYSRLLSFAAALIGMVTVYLFMTRTYTGTAIRAISQDRSIMPLMGCFILSGSKSAIQTSWLCSASSANTWSDAL